MSDREFVLLIMCLVSWVCTFVALREAFAAQREEAGQRSRAEAAESKLRLRGASNETG